MMASMRYAGDVLSAKGCSKLPRTVLSSFRSQTLSSCAPFQKQQFHCGSCGICRVGGADNFFHCATCGCCYARSLEVGARWPLHIVPILAMSLQVSCMQQLPALGHAPSVRLHESDGGGNMPSTCCCCYASC